MTGPWFSFGQPNSFGMPASFGAPASFGMPASFGRAMSFDAGGGDPMLAQGLATTRDALLASLGLDPTASLALLATLRTEEAATATPPTTGPAVHLRTQGVDERAASVLFEVVSHLSLQLGAKPEDGVELLADNRLLIKATCPSVAYFVAELDKVQSQAPLRAARAAEILTQLSAPYAYFASVLGLQSGRHAATMELLQASLAIAHVVCQRLKVAFAAQRPSEYSVQIQPMIDLPQHASFPAGHALQAHLVARLLARLIQADDKPQRLLRTLADRIAENRIVAGVHFPVDCRFGRLIGDCLASWLLSACDQPEENSYAWRGGIFDGASFTAPEDFSPSAAPFSDSAAAATRSTAAAALPLYAWLWARARAEWPAPRLAASAPQQAKAT